MLLKLILPLVTFTAFRFIMYSDNHDLTELRTQLYVVSIKIASSNLFVQDSDQTKLQKLHARVSAAPNPCTEVVCLGEGPPTDQIQSNLGSAHVSQKSFDPKFLSVKPKN